MTEPFTITDRRGSRRTAAGVHLPGANWDATARSMRSQGFTLPTSGTQARLQARQVVSDVRERGTVTDVANKAQMHAMRAERMKRTAANTQMVMPKVRQPLGTLMDKGIPFNVQDPKELIELRRWCRLFYSTHDLVPLLIDIYAKFPVQGMEFRCKDKKVEEFFEDMFINRLGYEEFLPDGLMREYFMVGEATALAHFNEQLGIWSSEEILNPDMIKVSKSLFVEQERVQLLVKDLVDSLRSGPEGMASNEESPSEKFERTWEYQQLVQHYPEIIKAAAQDDGLDVSDSLCSRLVNKAAWWDLRGTPHLLRSFRNLLLEESLNAAQDAVCDRLYAPMILATLGIEGAMGDGEPWIPDQGELEDLRDDIQAALAGDFKLLVHNFGLQVTPVFGRESVPRFDQDYQRVDSKLMQAWGIGEALIMGGSGGTYASSAINREVCEQLMKSAQNKAIKHMRKRMEIIAEAQEMYDFELKGGIRKPIYEHIVEINEETGEEEIVRVPKLLIPEVKFATLNLRDEATERQFVSELKQLGVPISDKTLAINIPFEFDQELERQSQETVDKGLAQAESMHVLQELCDAQDYPYPAELAQHLEATLELRAALAQTEAAETQNKMMDQQLAQASPAGMMGLLPGTTMQPLAGSGSTDADPAAGGDMQEQGQAAAEQNQEDAEGATADPTLGSGAAAATMPQPGQIDPSMSQFQMAAAKRRHWSTMFPPHAFPPGGVVDDSEDPTEHTKPEMALNRSRPEISDEKRGEMPKMGRRKHLTALPGKGGTEEKLAQVNRDLKTLGALDKVNRGPSSRRARRKADDERVSRAVRRREMVAKGEVMVAELVQDPDFWNSCHLANYMGQVLADWPEIESGSNSPSVRESQHVLEEALEQYEDMTGVKPRW